MSRVYDCLLALQTALSVITVANGYNTDIGTNIVLYDEQRPSTKRPSIAIGSRNGRIDRRDEKGDNGLSYSKYARQLDFVLEAGLNVSQLLAQEAAHNAREDIDAVYLKTLTNNAAMPTGVSRISFTEWSIVDRPEGIDAVVLRVIGVIDYALPTSPLT